MVAAMTELPTEFGFQNLLGFVAEEGEETTVVSIDLDDKHLNPNGVAHGGVAYAMMDTAMGRATMRILPEGKICATIEMQVRYLRGVTGGRLESSASVLKPGRSIVHLEARTVDSDGRLIATATSSYAVLDAP